MRTLTITFEEPQKNNVSIHVDWGRPSEATQLENRMAESAQPAVNAILQTLPAELVGVGYGETMEEAEREARVAGDIFDAGQ